MGRRDGHKAFFAPPKRSHTTKKKELNKKRARAALYEHQHGRHSKPGSQAGPRRQLEQHQRDVLLEWRSKGFPMKPEELQEQEGQGQQYGYGDALLDDFMGTPIQPDVTPIPRYIGPEQYQQYKLQVQDQMKRYQQSIHAINALPSPEDQALLDIEPLPSDHILGQLILAYRDLHYERQRRQTTKKEGENKDHNNNNNNSSNNNGNGQQRQRRLGLHRALSHVMDDLQVPIQAFGKETFAALFQCCATPQEAQHILMDELMPQVGIRMNAHHYAIYIHLIGQTTGDFERCVQILDESIRSSTTTTSSSSSTSTTTKENNNNNNNNMVVVPPTLAAYTSVLAACYQICSNRGGQVSPDIRAKAFDVGWSKWKELQIIGLEPDTMAYGAFLRLLSVHGGYPEQAIGILEEMKQRQIPYTTLCFTAALRAVARSHEAAIRFDNGSTRKMKRREQITSHHGQMTRTIVLMAEQAGVEQDDGFLAALMLCAAAAGDSSTAKAILLASDIRRMDHWRTIGSDFHLEQLQGHQNHHQALSSNDLYNSAATATVSTAERILSGQSSERLHFDSTTTTTTKKKKNDDDDDDVALQQLIMEGSSTTTDLMETESTTLPSSSKMMLTEEEQALLELHRQRSCNNTVNVEDANILPPVGSLRRKRLEHALAQQRQYGGGGGSGQSGGGGDSRLYNALLKACANAMNPSTGLGDIWEGRENAGYLCENSLRLICARPKPRYHDNSIPGIGGTRVGISGMLWNDEDNEAEESHKKNRSNVQRMSKKLRRAPFMGMKQDTKVAGMTMDDLDEYYYDMFRQEYHERIEKQHQEREDEVRPIVIGGFPQDQLEAEQEQQQEEQQRRLLGEGRGGSIDGGEEQKLIAMGNNDADDDASVVVADQQGGGDNSNSVSDDELNSLFGVNNNEEEDDDEDEDKPEWMKEIESVYYDVSTGTMRPIEEMDQEDSKTTTIMKESVMANKEEEEEWYFDTDDNRWKTRPRVLPEAKQQQQRKSTKKMMVGGDSQDDEGAAAAATNVEWYFDNDEMKWKTRASSTSSSSSSSSKQHTPPSGDDDSTTFTMHDNDTDGNPRQQQKQQQPSLTQFEAKKLSQRLKDSPMTMKESKDGLEGQQQQSSLQTSLTPKKDKSVTTTMEMDNGLPQMNLMDAIKPEPVFDQPSDEEFEKSKDLEEARYALFRKILQDQINEGGGGVGPDGKPLEFSDEEGRELFASMHKELMSGELFQDQEIVKELNLMNDLPQTEDDFGETLSKIEERLSREKAANDSVGSSTTIGDRIIDEETYYKKLTKMEQLPETEEELIQTMQRGSKDEIPPTEDEVMKEMERDADPTLSATEDDFFKAMTSSQSQKQDEGREGSSGSLSSDNRGFKDGPSTSGSSVGPATNVSFEMDPSGTMTAVATAPEVETRESAGQVSETSLGYIEEADGVDTAPVANESFDTTARHAAKYGDSSALEEAVIDEKKDDEEEDWILAELREVLPTMPENRLQRVRNAFRKNLNYPSILTLTTILRENMPEFVDNGWLKLKNLQNAFFVVEKAKEDGLLDKHVMNGMLEVVTAAGKVERALEIHQHFFQLQGLEPNEYSDRQIIRMLVKHRRLPRALKFKEQVEAAGRKLDVQSYGALIEYMAKHSQTGSALMLVQECKDVHEALPHEAQLKKLRELCRNNNLRVEAGIMGPDPNEWYHYGDRHLRRERSKKGMKGVQKLKNFAIRV